MVDPTGLKPAPHGLKGRRSVTRAPGQQHCRFQIADCRLAFESKVCLCRKRIGNWQSEIYNDLAVAEGFEPSIAGLTIRCLTNLATPQKRIGCGDESRTRTPSFTRRALCYPIELRRNLVDWEGFKPSQEVCRTSMLSVTSPARKSIANFRLLIAD